MVSAPRISVVIPTRQRCETVELAVRSLAGQTGAPQYEVIVVVDGSRDGTASALRTLAMPFSLQVLEQERSGASAARNHGAAAARGELLLFLDDDMEADPGLLAAHDLRHRQGAEAVLGHLPLHPDSPPSLLAERVARWAEARRRALERADSVPGREVRTGQLSVRRDLFERLGGFDAGFTRGGSFGGEDIEFGLRLERHEARIVFAPEAISRQRYAVDLRTFLARQRDIGRSEVLLVRRHPERVRWSEGWRDRRLDRWLGRWLWPLLRRPLLALVESRRGGRWPERFFDRLAAYEYGRGVRSAGGFPRSTEAVVLAFHALRDLRGARVIEQYGVPPRRFGRRLRWLRRLGFHFVTAEELLRLARGVGRVQRRALLLTFDDAFAELPSAALPILAELDAPAVVFAPSALVGGTNRWDERLGAPSLALCDASQLRLLQEQGLEIGSHGRTHRPLAGLSDQELSDEVDGSAADLAALGLVRPRLLAYPHGVSDERVCAAIERAGYRAAFTVRPGRVTPDADPWALPRIEVLRRDGILRLAWKIARARPSAKREGFAQ